MTLAQQLRKEGIKEGIKDGIKEGIERGKRDLLLRQLRLRFGDLPAWAEKRVNAGTAEELDTWAERILTAGSAEETLA